MTGSPLANGARRFNDKKTAKKQTKDRGNLQFRRAELLLKGIMIAFLEGELAEEVNERLVRLGYDSLDTWAGVENLEARVDGSDAIDPVVLAALREASV